MEVFCIEISKVSPIITGNSCCRFNRRRFPSFALRRRARDQRKTAFTAMRPLASLLLRHCNRRIRAFCPASKLHSRYRTADRKKASFPTTESRLQIRRGIDRFNDRRERVIAWTSDAPTFVQIELFSAAEPRLRGSNRCAIK